MKQDQSGNLYVEVDNLRLTYVRAGRRTDAANWAGPDVIRVQSYRGDGTRALHLGAEFPVGSGTQFVELIEKLCLLYRDAQVEAQGHAVRVAE